MTPSVTDIASSPFTLPAELPPPDPDARAHGERMLDLLRAEITAAGGWITFHRYMELCLYAPGLGYYSAGSRKLGEQGDFITAPELSPLFGGCIARQCAQVLEQGPADIIEIGGGSGALASSVLTQLTAMGRLPQRYRMLELSADLRQRQQQRLAADHPQLMARIDWIDRLPEQNWQGVVLANEVLDAMPVHRFRVTDGGFEEGFIGWRDGAFIEAFRPIQSPGLGDALQALSNELPWRLPPGYTSELNPAAAAWVSDIARHLSRGLILLADYGFPRAEFYHPERGMGTLMCHYRQRSHGDPLILPGLQDITAHVDFTAIGEAALDAGLRVAGYTSQAGFLINSGLLDLLAEGASTDRASAAANRDVTLLTSPAEMGELFKLIALTRGLDMPLLGFVSGDRRSGLG